MKAFTQRGHAAAAGDCLLEWDSVDGEKAPVPVLKDMFGSERRKAKVCVPRCMDRAASPCLGLHCLD